MPPPPYPHRQTTTLHRHPDESALGKATAYRVERFKTGGARFTTTGCDAGQSQAVIGIDGHQTSVDASGTTTSLDLGADPRWGMRAPIAARITMTTPGGLSMTTTAQRTVTLAVPGQLLNLSSRTQHSDDERPHMDERLRRSDSNARVHLAGRPDRRRL